MTLTVGTEMVIYIDMVIDSDRPKYLGLQDKFYAQATVRNTADSKKAN